MFGENRHVWENRTRLGGRKRLALLHINYHGSGFYITFTANESLEQSASVYE